MKFKFDFRPHYNLNLQGIAVNGQILSVDPSVFSTSNTRGTIIDSGTTLAYLIEEAYDPFVYAVSIISFSLILFPRYRGLVFETPASSVLEMPSSYFKNSVNFLQIQDSSEQTGEVRARGKRGRKGGWVRGPLLDNRVSVPCQMIVQWSDREADRLVVRGQASDCQIVR